MAGSQSKSISVHCPKCGEGFEIGPELAGLQGRCKCGHIFPLPAAAESLPRATSTTPAAQTPSPPKPKPPQHVGVSCRVCQTRMFGTLKQVGRALKCPDCGALTILPPPKPVKPKPLPVAMEGEQYELWGVDEAPANEVLRAMLPTYIPIECRMCRTLMHATLDQVGKKVKCPDCGTVHVVPAPPAPKAKPSVLVPDAESYQLDETDTPAERPTLVPPRRPMLYEEERDAALAEQAERRARGDIRGPQYDFEGRPILPRWPLVTRVLPFLFSGPVLARWVAMSAGLAFVLGVFAVAFGFSGSGGGFVGGSIGVIGGVFLALGAGVLAMIWFAAMSSFTITIVTESSEGNDQIQDWPAMNFGDWMGAMFMMMIAVMVSMFPGWLVGQLLPADGWGRVAAAMLGVLLFLPLVLLSQLDISSAFGVLSGRVLASYATCPLSWLLFYLEIAAVAAICIAVLTAEAVLGPAVVFLEIPVLIAALFLAARLLGRLAWKLAETMPADEEENVEPST